MGLGRRWSDENCGLPAVDIIDSDHFIPENSRCPRLACLV
jgi:hypothetical protein